MIKNIIKGIERVKFLLKAEPVQNSPDLRIEYLLGVRNQIQTLHWQTRSYAEHKALGGFYNDLVESLDDIVEVFQGRHGRINLSGGMLNIINYSDMDEFYNGIGNYIGIFAGTLREIRNNFPEDSDLQNIFDDLIGKAERTVYLLSLS